METYGARTTAALERAASSFPDDLALVFSGMVNDAAAAAIAGWRKLTGDDVEDARAELDALLQEAFLADDCEPGGGSGMWRGRCNVVSARWWT